ncbi:MAG: hypothetical protein HKN46_04090 [Acidimicrobiia bacterium]|nr:hypothetical protein [Acidimicrobiia bacterium]
MPWVWSDDVAARLVDAGLVDPDDAPFGAHPPVALAVDDPDDLAGLGQRFFGSRDEPG